MQPFEVLLASLSLLVACSSSKRVEPPQPSASAGPAIASSPPPSCPTFEEADLRGVPGFPAARRLTERSGATSLNPGMNSRWETYEVDASFDEVTALFARCLAKPPIEKEAARRFVLPPGSSPYPQALRYIDVEEHEGNLRVTIGCERCY